MKWIAIVGIVCAIAMQNVFFEMQGNDESPTINSGITTLEGDGCRYSEMSQLVDRESESYKSMEFNISHIFYTHKNLVDESKKVMVETICTDRVDNDGDSLIDSEDGDCWSKEGAIIDSHLCVPPVKFSQWKELIPILHNMGFKTLYLFPVMQHQPEWNYYAVIDYFKLHPAMISDGKQKTGEKELKELVDTAHAYGMKVIFDLPNAFVPSEELNGVDSWIWINHPDWVLRDIYGKPVKHWKIDPAYNYYILDWANPEGINYFVNVTEYSVVPKV